MSKAVGIPLSTLAKVEHNRLSMTYDKLLQVSDRLGVSFGELYSEDFPAKIFKASGRRSTTQANNTVTVESRNYDDHYLCTDLRKRIMTPIRIDVKSGDLDEFGDLISHDGEEFVYVVEGSIIVHTEYYEPTVLSEGQGHYLDSQMGHAYVRAEGCSRAVIIAVCASRQDGLEKLLIEQASGFPPPVQGPHSEHKKAKRGK